jgi:FkbM family methyltransferase
MSGMIAKLASDAAGLRRACGFAVAARWVRNVAWHFPQCLRRRDLQAADVAMGRGPFLVRLGCAQALLAGESIITGVREVWVRDCYLAGGFLTIGGDDVVVDLGANIGTFTMLALGHSPGVRVVAVEPNRIAGESLTATAQLNGWQERVQLCHAYLGAKTATQEAMLRDDKYQADFISQQQFIDRFNLSRIDFLKCDIEGSEFDLLKPDAPLLAMTRQLAVELHKAYGEADHVVSMLRQQGFEVVRHHDSPTDCVLNARRSL